MDPLLKMKLEAMEDDEALLALQEDDDDEDEESDSDMDSDFDDSGEEDVKPRILVKSEPGVDVEAVDDFERLVQDIKLNESTNNAGLLSKDWDFTVQDTGAYRRDQAAAAGFRFKHRRGVKLSFQTEALIGEGNQAYVNGDLATATKTMLEVLRIEPRAAAAWTVLAKCYEDRKEVGKALQMRIMGAHLKGDAEEWDSLARQSKELGHHQQALYCWSKVQNMDPSNVAALWDRAMLGKEIRDLKTTRNAFLGILDRFPHDLNILSEIRTVLVDLGELDTCKTLFQDAFTHYQVKFPSGIGPAVDTGVDAPGGGFGLLEVLVLADLYNTLGEHERAVDVTRKGVRWLQGRSAETYWDSCTDDREFDYDDLERVVEDSEEDLEPGYYELDVNARHRLAIARIRMGDDEEAKVHTDIVLAQDLMDYSPLFVEVADAYFDRELWAEARGVYEILGANETTSSVEILVKTAACMRNMDELQDAAEIYETVRKADPTDNDVKMRLAEIYEVLNEPRKALDLVFEVMDSRYGRRTRKCKTEAPAEAMTDENAPLIQDKALRSGIKRVSNAQYRLSNAELHKMEAEKEKETLEGWRRVKQLWARMLAGEEEASREWVVEAEKLVEAFRQNRRLFSTSRVFKGVFLMRNSRVKQDAGEEKEMLSRLQFDLAHESTARKTRSGDKFNKVDVFRGISLDDWLRLILQYSFTLTQRGGYTQADEVLRHILVSSAYHLPVYQNAIRLGLMTCASFAGMLPAIVEQTRKLHVGNQFNNEPLRMLAAGLGSGSQAIDSFTVQTLHKYLHREMRLADAAALRPDALLWSIQTKRFGFGPDDPEEEEAAPTTERRRTMKKKMPLPNIAKEYNPVIVAFYAQVLLAAGSFQSALYYFLLAFDHCEEDPMISLCITVASLGRAAQRQCANRARFIVQALAFMSRYRTYRAVDGDHLIEIEYNVGRTFHSLGLLSDAARHYERALEAASTRTDTGCAVEAAYNLSMIYGATGARHLAVDLYKRWLSI